MALLALGVFDITLIVAQPFLNDNVTKPGEISAIITSSVDTILYLLIVVELYHTIIAYVEDRDVIRAVVHAGPIAVARKIITLKPDEFQNMNAHLSVSASYALLSSCSSPGSTSSTGPNPGRTPRTSRDVTQIRI